MRIQPNITWRESILYTRIFLSDGSPEMQAQIRVIRVVVFSDSENDNDDNNKG